jgi:uncharacterized protein YhbP (UPF0306 family)
MQDGMDEPLFRSGPPVPGERVPSSDVAGKIESLIRSQRYAVLCTQGEGQPYGSLVAYAFSADLTQAVFATPETTRKYRLLERCSGVALLIDDRPARPEAVMQIEAVTATGKATRVDEAGARDDLAALLLEPHPYLADFLRAPTCALFRVEVVRFFHVVRFQEVSEWIPPARR